jgi:glycosyltransferase involved in cell wall biosynthesis
MKIAMVGTKGIPAKWGGIEKYIEEIGKRLVERGHEVTVFGSKWFLKDYHENYYMGMKIKRVPSIHSKATDALSNAFFAYLHMMKCDYDIVNFHGYASYYFVPLVKILGKNTFVTTHGVESGWDNPKYNSKAQKIIKKAFDIGIMKGDCVATVAEHLKTKIHNCTKKDVYVLPSGINEAKLSPPNLIKQKYGLNGQDYLLFLGRIDPIKRVDWLIGLKDQLNKNMRLVIAGGAQDPSMEEYLNEIRKKAVNNPDILFTGPVFGAEKEELLSNCRIFVAPSQDEGLPITVLEATSYGRCCVATEIPAFSEVIDDGITGFLFPKDDKNSFVQKVANLLNTPQENLENIGKKAKEKVANNFSWERTADLTENLFRRLIDERSVR